MARGKVIGGINCDGAATAAVKLVLCARFNEMIALPERALNWNDPEGVHDMRVASRRLRGALRDFMPYLNKRSLTSQVKQIKEIADALGEVRDHDVAINALDRLATKAPSDVAPALSRFVQARKRERARARKKLARAVRKRQLKQLSSQFTAGLERVTAKQSQPARSINKERQNANVSYREIGRSIIFERLDELEKLSNSLYLPLEVEPLHKMRIATKRLRYAIELFEQCWGLSIVIFARKAAGLQSALGGVHDCDVWIESFGNELVKSKKHRVQSGASSWLLSHFIKLRTRYLRNALARWCEWETEDFSGQLRSSLQIDVPHHLAGST